MKHQRAFPFLLGAPWLKRQFLEKLLLGFLTRFCQEKHRLGQTRIWECPRMASRRSIIPRNDAY